MNETQLQTITREAIARPNWVGRNALQKVGLVRDDSPSMIGRKARQATGASQDLMHALAEPENKNGFFATIIDFAGAAETVAPLQRATALADQVPALENRTGGGTNIADALRIARQNLDFTPADADGTATWLRPVTFLFTDGQANVGGSPVEPAAQLREVSDLVTVAFGLTASRGLLRKIATSPQHFYRCKNGRELRAFLAAAGRTMTATMACGQNATDALGSL